MQFAKIVALPRIGKFDQAHIRIFSSSKCIVYSPTRLKSMQWCMDTVKKFDQGHEPSAGQAVP